MYFKNQSLSQIVKEIIISNKVYFQSLQLGIANFTALAQKIKPDVDEITGNNNNINTIAVTIKRIADALHDSEIVQKQSSKQTNKLSGGKISLIGSIIDIEFNEEIDEIKNIYEKFENRLNRNFNYFSCNRHIKIFTEEVNEIKNILSNSDKNIVEKIEEGLSMISINLPENTLENDLNYGLIHTISDILFSHNIRIHDAFFTNNEIVLILFDRDAAKAYELLRQNLFY